MEFKRLFRRQNKNITLRKGIARQYFFAILIGTFLLSLGITQKQGAQISYVDAFFTAASAFTDTGITTLDVSKSYNTFGHVVILILLQLGAIGLMSVKAIFFIAINRKITTTDRMSLAAEHKQTVLNNMVGILKRAIIILVMIQFIFTIVMAAHMLVVYKYNLGNALWFSYFHCTAALTNGGFDLTGNYLNDFSGDYLFQIYVMFLIVCGGLGFPIIVEIDDWIKSKAKKRYYHFSLFAKLSLITYFVTTIIGFILLTITDFSLLYDDGVVKGFFYTMFHTISSRSSGLSTIPLNDFSQSGKQVLMILMFIGAAPASAGGGIRTTTLAIAVLYIRHFATSKSDVDVFNRRIPTTTIFNSFVTITVALFMVVIASLFISIVNPQFLFNDILFEVVSSFGTTGLSLGVSAQLDAFGKIVMALIMMLGQLGITNFLVIISKNKEVENLVRLPEENVTIG